jgi:hypothetical protein
VNRISIRGVLIGGIVDIVASLVLGIPFALYLISKLDVAHTPKDQVGSMILAAMQGNVPVYVAQLVVGLACSVLGGYLAARLAKHDELLNGALSSFLCLVLGVFTLSSGKESHPLVVQILLFAASPALGLFGGYLSILRRQTSTT